LFSSHHNLSAGYKILPILTLKYMEYQVVNIYSEMKKLIGQEKLGTVVVQVFLTLFLKQN